MISILKQCWKGIVIAIIVGVSAVLLNRFLKLPILDPLFIALIIGVICRSFIKFKDETIAGFNIAPSLFIPVGVIFYGAVNLNFSRFMTVDTNFIFMLFIVFLIYLISSLLLANLFGLNEKTGYLIAAGSTICGASAIAITSKAIDASADDVSISLISVFISALIGLFILMPLVGFYFKIEGANYGFFSGSVLQFTGFVKASVANLPGEVQSIAISVKALRYVGLLFLIPLFASFVKGKFHVPWYLWAFLGAGLIFNFVPNIASTLGPVFKIALTIMWSIAMAAIGFNADSRLLFTRNGLRAFMVSFISFVIAVSVFIGGIKII